MEDASCAAPSSYGALGLARRGTARSTLLNRLVPRTLAWTDAAWAINASVIGIGVLCIPSSFASLGWILGFSALVLCLLANIFVAHLMQEIQQVNPLAITLADAAYYGFGRSESAKQAVRWTLYTEKLASGAPSVALAASMLGSSFYQLHLCQPFWCAIAGVLFVLMSQRKSLQDTFWLNVLNIVSVVASAALALAVLVSEAPMDVARVAGVPRGVGSLEVFSALSVVVFAYSGNWLYFEVMAEMTHPEEFMKAFTIAGPLQLGLYTLVSTVVYASWGSLAPPSTIEGMRFGPLMQAASLLLAVHVFCGTITSMVVLTRFMHSRVSPEDVNEDTLHAKVVRASITVAVYGSCVFAAVSVPSFGSLVGLLGALFEAPISFVLPYVLFLAVKAKSQEAQKTSAWVYICGGSIALVGVAITVMGVVGAVLEISQGAAGVPFACNCHGMWNTCGCSPSRMPEGYCPA